jgi:predicted nucleic acid-binding protein
MRIIIHDASVLIDLVSMEVLNEALSLPYEMAVPDLVVHEITNPKQREALLACLQDGHINELPLTGDEIVEAALMMNEWSGLSIADCSVILKARQMEGMILSADMALRKKASALGFEVHGSLWLVERLHADGTISAQEACDALTALEGTNSRIPRNECMALKEKIGKMN